MGVDWQHVSIPKYNNHLHHSSSSHQRAPALTMVATTRLRNSSTEKSDAPGHSDGPRSRTSANGSNGLRDPAGAWGRLGTTVFYIVLLAATGFTAFQLQRVADRSQEMSAEQEKSAQNYASMTKKMDLVSQEIGVLRRVVDGLETSLSDARKELEGAMNRIKTEEAETRRMEEALRKLHGDAPPSESGVGSEVESLLARYSVAEGALAALRQAVQQAVAGFQQEMEVLKSSLGELKSDMAALGDAGTVLTAEDSDMRELVKNLEERLAAVESVSNMELDYN